jgi:ABC-type bacteriocin/lantibiotic exporter with double-glycine peptidase domain
MFKVKKQARIKKFHILNIKRISILSFLLYLLFQGSALIAPFIMKQIIDVYIPISDIKNTIFSIIVFVLVPCIVVLIQVLYNYITIKFIRNKGNEMSISILKKVTNQNLNFFNDKDSIELSNKIGRDTIEYLSYYVSEQPELLVSVILGISSLVYIFINNPIIGFVQLIFIPLLFPIKLIYKNINSSIKKTIDNNAKSAQYRGDLFRGIKYIKTNNIENYPLNKIEELNKETSSIWGKIASLDTLSGFWGVGFLTMLFSGITFGLSAIFFINEMYIDSIGTIIALFSYASIYYNYTNKVFKTLIDKKKIDSSYQELLNDYNKFEVSKEVKKELLEIEDIKINNLSYSYVDEKEVLKNITLNFKAGNIYGIQGESGIGKTTLLDLMIKLYHVNNESIYINSIDINDLDDVNIRSLISKVTQEIFIFPGSIKENFLIINPNLSDDEIYYFLEISELKDYILKLPNALDSMPGELGKLLSGGERQRLSIAIALSRKTKWVLFDEVTSNMDSLLEGRIQSNLNKYIKENNISAVIVSHSSEFLKICDFIFKIN